MISVATGSTALSRNFYSHKCVEQNADVDFVCEGCVWEMLPVVLIDALISLHDSQTYMHMNNPSWLSKNRQDRLYQSM